MMGALFERERKRLLNEVLQFKGLMPLLMKPRNGRPWSPDDRVEIRTHLRRLCTIAPYLILCILPGSPLTLPLLAWWLDRRRGRRMPPTPPVSAVAQP
jgi:hypothetical protein